MEEIQEIPGHASCRIREFVRWPRIFLEHEREHISYEMVNGSAFMTEELKAGLMHDLSDVDYLLAQIPPKEKNSD